MAENVSLLDGRFEPIASHVGFIEADATDVAYEMVKWGTEIGLRHEAEEFRGSFEFALNKLLPLTNFIQRFLFFPARGPWTAYHDNSWLGTDPAAITVLCRRRSCRGMRVVAVEDTIRGRKSGGRYGAAILEVYGPDGKTARAVWAANDGGKWTFGQIGTPFPFERVERYGARPIRSRFTAEMLTEYLDHLGIQAFEDSFYPDAVDRSAILLHRIGATPKYYKEYTLEEARR